MLEQAQRGVGMAGRTSHLFFPGWNASAVSRTVGWFPESAKGTGPYKGVQSPICPGRVPPSCSPPPLWNHKQKPINLNFLGYRIAPSPPFCQTAALSFLPSLSFHLKSNFFSPPLLLPEVSRHYCLSSALY